MKPESTPGLWQNPDFLKLWVGQTVSEIGSRITREGIPLTAVLVLHANASQMGVLTGLGAAAVLVFGLTAGVWVDRVARRPILIATDLGRAALLSTVPLAAAWHVLSMTQLYAVAALVGVLTVFFDVAYQSYLPSLVDRGQILEGNTKLTVTATAAEILGPGITGVLVKTITAPTAILIDALSFVFSASMVFSIRHRDGERVETTEEEKHIVRESLAGLRFIQGQASLRWLAIRSVVAYFSFGLMWPLYVLYSMDTLHLNPAQLGVAVAMGGVGAMLGASFAPRLARRLNRGTIFVGAAIVHALAMLMIPLAHGTPLVAMAWLIAGQLIGDAAFSVYMIHETTLRQTLAPGEVLGRVNAAMQLASRGMLPLGAVVGGLLAERIGLRPVFVASALGALLSVAWLIPLSQPPAGYNRG